ncbi:hypothetical protein GHV16_18245 [Klebsiella pneumoniae]|uniref:hypothetical protein n=1 Tax=Klebsiella pneumoniae TaxID=573 RepID=UPI000C1EFF1B|nr:hypothetical protein [Klebsiella pneumoniae]MBG2534242.1 hypothetical protein [Klebsiella pneumoniae]MBX9263926.1 hypothetical protein [Klebsiella pneumoniae]MCM5741793.1 hypothetical protein [Klebsiella pneumoniae]HBZ7496621.1 hypothetical protein [Klebsiella pneumoniae]HCB1290625.1 hypothetical protein [Klebsiella pneumoniae]
MQKNIFYYPYDSGVNKYAERVRSILSGFSTVMPLNIKEELYFFLTFKKKRGGVAIINWIENMIITPKRRKISLLGVLKLIVSLLVLKYRFDKVIYIQHNLYPHDTFESHIKIAKWIIEKISLLVDVVVVHSPLFQDKIYIPHPLYEYPLKEINIKSDLIVHKDSYLIFGRIEKYKKIEEIIISFPPSKKLIIAGFCNDKKYEKELNEILSNKENITFIPRYLTDEEASLLFMSCKALIIGHADQDMIVSGSFFYSLTQQLPVLAIKTPFLEWVQSESKSDILLTFNNIISMMEFIESQKSGFDKKIGFDKNTIDELNSEFGDDYISKIIKTII